MLTNEMVKEARRLARLMRAAEISLDERQRLQDIYDVAHQEVTAR